jgi:NADH:quinone reductase (non-electrogenic)
MRTRITELFGIKHPIVQGGMHHVGFAELAAAVSNAGGLGMITALTQPSPLALAQEIRKCRNLTARPFGVNVTFLPSRTQPDYPGIFHVIVEEGVRVVETAGNNPRDWVGYLKDAGVKILHKCTSVKHALTAERIGCDAISMDGFECAGHPGGDDIPNLILLPLAAKALKVPFIASGGMVDGRSLVAALALGAEGMNMGTRFIATQEAPVHPAVKAAIVNASVHDTRIIMRPLNNTERVYANSAIERILDTEKRLGDALQFSDIAAEVSGVYPKVMKDGLVDIGAWSVGQVLGLVDDVPTVQELVGRIMAEADELITGRLADMNRASAFTAAPTKQRIASA